MKITNHHLLIAVMLCAFAVSAANIVAAAVHVAGIGSWVAYAYPIGVDIALAMVIRASAQRSELGERNRAERMAAVALTIFSVIVNAAHSPRTVAALAINCAPPVVILLVSYIAERAATLERRLTGSLSTVSQLDQSITERRDELDHLSQKVSAFRLEIDTLKAQKRSEKVSFAPNDTLQIANDTREAKAAERRADVLKLLQGGMKQTQIAEQLGVGLATVKRDVKALNGRAHHLVAANEGDS